MTDDNFYKAEEWLVKHGKKAGDVIYDEDEHAHYINIDGEEGFERVYVPKHLEARFF